MDLDKIKDFYDDHEEGLKIISCIVMFLVGLASMCFAISCGSTNFAYSILFGLLGLVFGFLGIAPLAEKWCNWVDFK